MAKLTVAEMMGVFIYHPVPPFYVLTYDAVRGLTWTIMDGNNRHIATAFDEEGARLLVHRLNT